MTTCTHKFIKIINFQLVIKLNCQTQENNKLTPIEVKNIKHHSKFNIFGLFETKKIPSITNNNVDKKKLATQIKTSGVFIMPIC